SGKAHPSRCWIVQPAWGWTGHARTGARPAGGLVGRAQQLHRWRVLACPISPVNRIGRTRGADARRRKPPGKRAANDAAPAPAGPSMEPPRSAGSTRPTLEEPHMATEAQGAPAPVTRDEQKTARQQAARRLREERRMATRTWTPKESTPFIERTLVIGHHVIHTNFDLWFVRAQISLHSMFTVLP